MMHFRGLNRLRAAATTVLIAGLGLLVSACGSSEPVVVDTEPSLAVDSEAAGWRAEGRVRVYRGEALFDYFPVDSDVFTEYGCQVVRVQDYVSPIGDVVRVELLQVDRPDGAYGIFSMKTNPGGELVDVGTQGWLEQDVINFWRGRTQVTLTKRSSKGVLVRNFLSLATAVDQGLSGAAEPPPVVRLLPPDGLLPKGVVYLAGPAGIRRQFRGWPWRFPDALGGVVGTYTAVDGGFRIALLEYADAEEASLAGKDVAPDGIVKQGRRMTAVLSQGKYLVAYAGPVDYDQAKIAMSRAVKRLGGDAAPNAGPK